MFNNNEKVPYEKTFPDIYESPKTKCKDDLKKVPHDEPSDPFGLVRVTCFLLGICSVMAIVFFITANEYWMYKFRNVTSNSSDANDRTVLQANFTSTYSIMISVPNVIFVFISTFIGHKVSANAKAYTLLITVVVALSMQALFVEVNTDDWQVGFFALTMVTVVAIAATVAVGIVGLLSVISKLPEVYMHYFLFGQSGSEIFSALLRIFTLWSISSFKASAVLYFMVGVGIYAVTLIMYFVMSRREFFRYYINRPEHIPKKNIHSLADIFDVIKDIWVVIILIGLVVIIPIAPAITSLVVSEYAGTGSAWGDTYFVPVVTYLFPSLCSILGRITAATFPKTITLPFVFTVTIVRLAVFPPLLYLCNAKPRHNFPVVFPHDWEYVCFYGPYAFLTGYLMSVSTVLTLKCTTQEKLDRAFTLTMLSFFAVSACVSPIGSAFVNFL